VEASSGVCVGNCLAIPVCAARVEPPVVESVTR
jgi:hypothetical protein